jgi:heme a synthase
MRRLLRIFTILTSIVTYLIILLGVLVTSTGSGRGCGNSWPFCHGQIIPGVITIAGLIEYSHRVVSSVDGLFVLILSACAWFMYRRDARVKLFAALSLLFVALQGALGALTVVYEGTFALNWLLSVHFGLSLIAFASVILLTIRLFQLAGKPQPDEGGADESVRRLRLPIWSLALYTYIVAYTGALVEHTGAVTGCGYQLPACGSTYLPNFTSLAGIQVLHRYVAGLLWLLVLCLLVAVVRRYRERHDIVRGSWWAFILISLQALSGMLNVWTEGQLLAALLHTTLISIFFSTLCFLCVQIGWPWQRAKPRRVPEGQSLQLKTVP